MDTICYYKSEKYPYKGYGDCNCICGIEVMNHIVIVTELDENMGTSVTNACEVLAKQICEDFSIEPNKLILIERYPESRVGYSRVILKWDSGKQEFSKAETTWRFMTTQQVQLIKDNAITDIEKKRGFI